MPAQCDKKHGAHFHSIKGKADLLRALGVDSVVPNIDDDGTCCKTLTVIHPDIYAVGDYEAIPERELCAKLDIEVYYNVGARLNRSSDFWKSLRP